MLNQEILKLIRCSVEDCVNNDKHGLCQRKDINISKIGRCLMYGIDKERMRKTLHKLVTGFSADPETEAVVFGLAWNAPVSAGEEEKQVATN